MVIGGFDKVGEEEKLRTMLHVNPYMLHLRGQDMLVPYLVGIATAPEARGQHLLRPLLETAFEVLRSQGFPFVTLMPISAGIYLPYEFAYCYYRHEYKMPLAKLQPAAIGDDLSAERLDLVSLLQSVTEEKLSLAILWQIFTQVLPQRGTACRSALLSNGASCCL